MISEAGRGARSALFGLLLSLKRRVRAVQGRARAAKTQLFINIQRGPKPFLSMSFMITSPQLRHKKYYVQVLLFMLQPLAQN